MKRWIYTCDQCGAEIPDAERWAMRLANPEDLEKGSFLFEGKYEFDLCAKCAEQLVEHIAGTAVQQGDGRKEPTKESAEVQQDKDTEGQQGPNKSTEVQQGKKKPGRPKKQPQEIDIGQDKDAEGQQGPKKPGQPRKCSQEIDTGKQPREIDAGKVMALYNANWLPTEIAADMKLTEEEVRDVIEKELKKRRK